MVFITKEQSLTQITKARKISFRTLKLSRKKLHVGARVKESN